MINCIWSSIGKSIKVSFCWDEGCREDDTMDVLGCNVSPRRTSNIAGV